MKIALAIVWSMYSIIAALFGLDWAPAYNPADTPASELPSTVIVGEMRVQLLSDTLVRIEKEGPRGFENRSSFTVQKRTGWDTVEYTESKKDGYAIIATENYTVYLPENADSCDGAFVTNEDGEVLWTFQSDTNSNVYLPSPSDELKSWYFTDTPRVIPSEDGYSVSKLWHKLNGWDMTNDSQDVFVFLPDGDYETFTSDFVELTGRSEMLSLNLLGYWDSRYYEYTSESAMQQIEDYYSKGYPLDVLVIDTDWRISTGGTGYTVNPVLFPNMRGFLKDVHKKGISVVFNDHPEPTWGTTNLLDKPEMLIRNFNLKKVLSTGLDYWWYDRNWWTSLEPIHDDLSIYTTGMYAYREITNDYYESVARCGEYSRRPLIMANVDGIDNGTQSYASELAAHRYSLQWTGDIGVSSDSLRGEIFNTVYGGNIMGLPYLSSDLGGHSSEVTSDMYVRWIQYGALSPIMRVHCTKPYSRMPWLYGEVAEDVTHTYVDMRYRLLPVFYSLAHENYETGLPLTRRLDVNYPQYVESSRNDEYLLGDDILVAPIYESYPETIEGITFTSDGKPGLKGEYYNNDKFEGEPEIVRYDERIYFDWVFEAPFGLSVSDYFAVRWSGKLTVGDKPVFLEAYADDGIRVTIDGEVVIDGWDTWNTYFRTDFLEANSVHDIVIEYCDGNNHAHVFVTAHCDGEAEREVFIPDGKWMDIWTGETFQGPTTIKLSHTLETSPVFVRMGSVLTLADNMKNTSEKDWSHLTLEIFPSADYEGSTVLYEDDTETVAYKDGKYRTTDITLKGDKTQVLTINPAVGSFDGERAFTKREYTVRIHGRDGWGKLNTIKLNGKAIDFTVIEKDADAEPLAIIGAARDNTVYQVTFTADVYEKIELTFCFDSAVADEKNENYDSTAVTFDMKINSLVKDTADFTVPADSKDFILYCADKALGSEKKAAGDGSLSEMNARGEIYIFDDNYNISWTDGVSIKQGTTSCGIVNSHEMTTVLKSDGKNEFRLYLGGHKSVASITVKDRSGNVKTLSFGNMDSNYYKEVVISTDGVGELEVTYSMLCGNNITAAACVKK